MPKATVLVVEDSSVLSLMLRVGLEDSGLQVVHAPDGVSALRALADFRIDVVLLDWKLPDLAGPVLLEAVLAHESGQRPPVVVMTSTMDPVFVATVLDAGAHDFLRKPFAPEELLARVQAAVRVKQMDDDLRAQALTDSVTGLPSRRNLLAVLPVLVAASRRYAEPLACVHLDVKRFRQLRDGVGSVAADNLVKGVAERVQKVVPPGDHLSRWEVDEMVVVLPRTELSAAQELAVEITRTVAQESFWVGTRMLTAEVRTGVAALHHDELDDDGSALLRRAAEALDEVRLRSESTHLI